MTIHASGPLATSRRLFLLSTVALGLAAVVPHKARSAEETPRGGSISINIGTEPPVLVLIAHSAGAAYYISGKATESLLTYDKDFKPQPLLATEWKVSDDGLRYWFKLRQGVKWHDGKDFTAEDVAFSIFALKENHPRGRATFAYVQKANVLNPYEVEPDPFQAGTLSAQRLRKLRGADRAEASLRGHQDRGKPA